MADTKTIDSLATYRLLGRSGLRVSPLGLGAMTFGWGAEKDAARALFTRYLEAGGNFVDTADAYNNGASEEWLGDFLQETKTRDRVVLATKFTFNTSPGDPNAGGNGRKNIYRALEGSLKRLKTDYIDLYWLHAWDTVTPVEEVISTLDCLVREGKVRHVGLSDVPAWYATRAHTLAEARGLERPIALQLEYSLISRNLEREHYPAARELGMGIVPWSPLGSGFLTGKYQKSGDGLTGQGRVQDVKDSGNPVLEKFARNPRNWEILEALRVVAGELGRTPAEVALNWAATQPGVASTLVGATRLEQLETNLRVLEFTIPESLRNRLDEASRPEENELDHFFGPFMRSWIQGGTRLESPRGR